MWSNDFDDFTVESKRKRRKIEPKSAASSVLKIKEPKTIEYLATHSRKIAEVREWLLRAGNRPDILLLTGPAGSAKTVTLKVVAKSQRIDIQEWVNPVDKLEHQVNDWLEPDPYDSAAYTEPKQIEKFEGFAFRSSRYQTLFSHHSRRIILVEDFPNHFIWKPSVFFDFLAKFKVSGQCPIVFICTDDEKIDLSCALFPNNVRDCLNITNIKFNPVSHTGVMKVLQSSASFVAKETLTDIAKASNGDIRTALSSIQFLLAGRSGLSKQASEAVVKDTSTEFFQTLGRVLYPKRREAPSESGATFLYDVQTIAEHYNVKFLTMLQENFLNTFSSLKDVTEGCAILSDCDLLSRGGELESYAGFICVTGLMVANKHPKKCGFQPMSRSRWSGKKLGMNDNSRPYPHLMMTSRTLNLDVIPYLKHFPQYAGKLALADADRLRSAGSGGLKCGPVFKAPPPPNDPSKDDETEEMVIEEFED